MPALPYVGTELGQFLQEKYKVCPLTGLLQYKATDAYVKGSRQASGTLRMSSIYKGTRKYFQYHRVLYFLATGTEACYLLHLGSKFDNSLSNLLPVDSIRLYS